MGLSGIRQYPAVQNSYAPQKEGTAAKAEDKKAAGAGTDTVTISGNADYLQTLQRQFPKMSFTIGTGFTGQTRQNTGNNANRWAFTVSPALLEKKRSDPEAGEKKADEEESGNQTGTHGRVGINAAKLARMLAAAKTRAQVQAVMAKIEADLRECDTGKAQGMDVDEASVQAAEQLLQEAKSRMSSAENREATPAEEMASALASLM